MKDHTLMQTIARANRVTSFTVNEVVKANGEIVDYYNVFRNMKKALKEYALGDEGEEEPVQDKTSLFVLLDDALKQGDEFCKKIGIELKSAVEAGGPLAKVGVFESFADKLLQKDEFWKEFKVYENTISSLYEACKPEILEGQFRPMIAVFQYLRGVVDTIIGQSDIDSVKQKIGELLDQSIVTSKDGTQSATEKSSVYQIVQKGKSLDLSKMNFEKLKEEFKTVEHKYIEIANLRGFIEKKLDEMLKDNSTRTDIAKRLQEIIDRYNSGGLSTENYYDELVNYTAGLKEEDERHVREGLSKDELELFDILKKEKMTVAEYIKVKNAAKYLLHRLLEEQPKVLIQDWFKDSQSQERVKAAVQAALDQELPKTYDKALFQAVCTRAYDLIYDYASKGLKWAA
jgi:type I restriction enzyme R subunit